MAKRIKNSSDLPCWYSLDKYRELSNLDYIGWYWQFATRLELFKFVLLFDEFEKHREKPIMGDLISISTELLSAVRSNPIFDPGNPHYAQRFVGQNLPMPNGSGIRLANENDLYEQLPEFQDKQSIMANFFASEVLLVVSLDVPDKVLIENFSRFLHELKAARGGYEVGFNQNRKIDLKEWERLGVLPYIDLKLWEKQFGVAIPNRVMADAIFNHGDGGEEVVRKTTAKVVEQIFTRDILNTLSAFHMAESEETASFNNLYKL